MLKWFIKQPPHLSSSCQLAHNGMPEFAFWLLY